MTLGFRQIPLRDWTSGSLHQIAAISTTMADLVSLHGLEPDRIEQDGLGWVQYVVLELPDGTQFILEWGELGPSSNVTISADVRDPVYSAALKKLLSALELDPKVVLGQTEDGYYGDLLGRQRGPGYRL